MYIELFTWIIFFTIVYGIQKIGGNKNFSTFSQRNGKLPLPRKKQGNYQVIPIYGWGWGGCILNAYAAIRGQ